MYIALSAIDATAMVCSGSFRSRSGAWTTPESRSAAEFESSATISTCPRKNSRIGRGCTGPTSAPWSEGCGT